jgi:hypothetical protein
MKGDGYGNKNEALERFSVSPIFSPKSYRAKTL